MLTTLTGAWAERIKSFRWRPDILARWKGGAGSGNHGHEGRPGEVEGSRGGGTFSYKAARHILSPTKSLKAEPTPTDSPSGGHNPPLSDDERRLRSAVKRVFKAQAAEVHGRVESGEKVRAVTIDSREWDKRAADEVRPAWYRVFKRGGDEALERVVRRVGKGWEPVDVVCVKGGPGSGNYGHEGRPGEVGGSGPGGGIPYKDAGLSLDRVREIVQAHPYLYHITSRLNTQSIRRGGLNPSKEGYSGPGVYFAVTPEQTEYYHKPGDPDARMFRVRTEDIAQRYGIGPNGAQFDESTGEMVVPSKIPPDLIETQWNVFDPEEGKVVLRWRSYRDQYSKSLKARAPVTIVIPEWIEDPDVLDALEREIFKFAHSINQTTADEALKRVVRRTGKGWEPVEVVVKGGSGSGNFGHEGRPGEVGGSGPGGGDSRSVSPNSVRTLQDLRTIAQIGSLPKDDDKYEYFYHAFRYRGDADTLLQGGKEGKTWLSKDEIRDRGAGYAVVRVPKGEAVEGRDFVESGLTYREWTVDKIPASNIVSIVRDVPVGSGGHGIRENELAAWAIDHQGEDTSDLPEAYRGWFNIKETKFLKAMPTPTTIIPEWVDVACKGGPGSGNFGHEGRPGEVGGSGGGGTTERVLKDSEKWGEGYKETPLRKASAGLKQISQSFAKQVRDDQGDLLSMGKKTSVPISDLRTAQDAVKESTVKYFLQGGKPGAMEPDIIVFDVGGEKYLSNGHHRVVAEWVKGSEKVEVRLIQIPNRKSFKAPRRQRQRPDRPSITIPEWVTDPETLLALERELFKFAHSINQTTADALREALIEGMEAGESIASLSDRIADLSDEWVEGWRSEMIARTESARAITEGRAAAWKATGVVERKVWLAAGDACPFCLEMDGKAVGLDETFLDKGDTQEAEWRGQDIEMEQDYADVNGPPLHPNCRCVLVAELSEKGMAMLEAVEKGGSGSGNYGHAGRPGEVGGSGEGGGGGVTDRASRAAASYKPMTARILAKAHEMEAKVAVAVNGKQLPDNEPFDVVRDKDVFEVKTIVRGKNPKITMHPESLARKIAESRRIGAKPHTVVVDIRGGRLDIYYKEGLGSFRLKNMEKLSGWAELRRRVA